MCGRATGHRGELRLAKLSLAVSDSFLPERRKRRKEEARDGQTVREEDAEDPTVPQELLAFPRLSPLEILRSVKSHRFPVFLQAARNQLSI